MHADVQPQRDLQQQEAEGLTTPAGFCREIHTPLPDAVSANGRGLR
jgi:hypothetical protein